MLTINGNNFVSYSALNFNGTSLIPTFVSSHQLVATIPAAAIAQPGPSPVFVLNPPTGGTTSAIGGTGPTTTSSSCGGYNSNALSFTVSP